MGCVGNEVVMTTTVNIQLLGIPTLNINGRKRKLYSAKVLGLLAYLVLESEKSHSRQKLATLLWGESSDKQARHSLRQALYSLRKTLGDLADKCLTIDSDTIRLEHHENLRIDVVEFLEIFKKSINDIDQLCHAVNLYQGQFLEGLDIEEEGAFDEWLYLQRHSLEQQILHIHETLIDQFIARHTYQDALLFAQKLVMLNPIHEGAYRRLIQIYAALGNRDEVRNQYRRCKEVLRDELQVTPSTETETLYHQLVFKENVVVNLPTPPTPFVGREKEIGELGKILVNPNNRLTTIIGTGGIGKTRLSLAIGEQLIGHFRDGVYFVPLSSIHSDDSIISGIADAIQLQFFGRKDPTSQLHDFLRQKELLLILDNFEHLIDGATLVTDILEVAPQLKILVTSREKLNLRGETVFVLGGLDFPEESLKSVLEQYGAVKLFIQTAKRVNQSFQADTDNLEAIINICRIVDGMPLGIELAAAWVEVLTLEEIIVEIQQGLDFLKTTLRDMPARHHSIRAVFDSTWKRLSIKEQQSLAQLSVFQGSFTRSAAQEVTNASLQVLMTLVGKSLLTRGDRDRFQIHELLRQYCAEKLVGYGNDLLETTKISHSAYYCRRLEEELPRLKGYFQIEALSDIEVDLPNVRVAWMWAVQKQDEKLISQALPSLSMFYHMRNRYHECIGLLQLVIGHLKDDPTTELYASLIIKLGRTNQSVGDLVVGVQYLEQGLAIAKRHGNLDLQVEALVELGTTYNRLGNFVEAEGCLANSLDLVQKMDDLSLHAYTLRMYAIMFNNRGDYEAEAKYCHDALALYQEMEDLFGKAHTLNLLGVNANDQGHYLGAKQYYIESLAIQRELNNRRGIAACLINLGVVAYALDDFESARHYYAESLAIRYEIGDRWGVAACLGNLGIVVENLDEAQRYQEESLMIFREVGSQRGVANSLTNLGELLQKQGKHEESDQFYANALAIYQEINFLFGVAICSVGIGNLAREQGDLKRAWKVYCEAIEVMGKQPVPVSLLGLVGLAGVIAAKEQYIAAAQWLGLALYHPVTDFDVEKMASPILTLLENEMSKDRLDSAIEQGKTLSFESVVDAIIEDGSFDV